MTATTTLSSLLTVRRAALLAVAGTLAGLGCDSFQSQTPAHLAPEPQEVSTFVGTTQPVRDFPPIVSIYQNGDTASGSTGIRWVNGGQTPAQTGQTGPAGGYGYVGANGAGNGAGAASGIASGSTGASSDTGFAAPAAGTAVASAGTGTGTSTGTGTGTVTPSVDASTAGGIGSTPVQSSVTVNGAPVGTSAAQANQTAAANAASVGATVAGPSGTGAVNDLGTPNGSQVITNANNQAAISNSTGTSTAAGTAVGSGTGAGTTGGTDVTGQTGIDANGVVTSNSATAGGATVAGANAGETVSGSPTGPSFSQQAQTAGQIAAVPVTGSGVFLANVVTAPYTLYEQRHGIVSSGVQFPASYTLMPALPPTPENSPVNPQDRVVVTTPPVAGLPISANLGGEPTTQPTKPAILMPSADAQSKTAFTINGDVQFPGRYETGTTVTLSEAMNGAGVNSAADPAKVKFRLVRDGEEPAEATLAQLQDKKVEDVALKPGDVLTVTLQPGLNSLIDAPATTPTK